MNEEIKKELEDLHRWRNRNSVIDWIGIGLIAIGAFGMGYCACRYDTMSNYIKSLPPDCLRG